MSCAAGAGYSGEDDVSASGSSASSTSGSGGGATGGAASGGAASGGAASGGAASGGAASGGGATGGAMTGGSGSGAMGAGGSGAMGAGGSGGMAVGGAGGSGPVGVVQLWTFKGCAGGWTSAGINNDWACGAPSSGPNADHSGDGSLWATDLGGNANTCQDSWLQSPAVNLSSCSGTVTLHFWHWYDFRECTCFCALSPNESDSGGVIEVNSGNGWVAITPVGGYESGGHHVNCASANDCNGQSCGPDQSSAAFTDAGVEKVWHETKVDISAHLTKTFQIRFRYGSHAGFGCFPNRPGWYIDDVSIVAPSGCP